MNSDAVSSEAMKGSAGEKAQDIRSRSFAYALRAIELYQYLQLIHN